MNPQKRQSFAVPGKPMGFKRPETRGKRRFTHAGYRAYRERVALTAMASGIKPIPLDGKSTTSQDVDNVAKSFMDALQHGIAYEDDKQIADLRVKRIDQKTGLPLGNVKM